MPSLQFSPSSIAENDRADAARQFAEDQREVELQQREKLKKRKKLKKFRREFRENVRVGFVIEFSSDDKLFSPCSFEDQINVRDFPHPSQILRYFCLCAAQFYQSKGFDISDVKVIDLQNNLERDGFENEFIHDVWVIYLLRNIAAPSLSSTLQVVYRHAEREPEFLKYPGFVNGETGNELRAGAEDEEWNEMLEENHHREGN